jgi:hypothetical protein
MLAVFVLVSFACALPVSLPVGDDHNDDSAVDDKNPISILEDLMDGETANAPDEAGTTRRSPLPVGTLLSVPGWELKVIQFLRGDDALRVIRSSGQQVGELPAGKEFALVKIFVRCTALDSDAHDIGLTELFITGNSHVAYGDTLDGIPQPEFLYEDMYSAEAVEGWIDALIPVNEQDLMAVLDLQEYKTDRITRFFALEEGASVSLPENFSEHEPNQIGASIDTPAKVGEQIITSEWEIRLLNASRGAQAETAIQRENPLFNPPQEGMDYVLLEIALSYFGINDSPVHIGPDNFYAVDRDGKKLAGEWVRVPKQSMNPYINATVFPGAELAGWIAISTPADTDQPLIVFDPDRYHSEKADVNLRYLLIE